MCLFRLLDIFVQIKSQMYLSNLQIFCVNFKIYLFKLLNVFVQIREGCKKNPEKVWSFAKPPSDPPSPVWHFFRTKNLPPFFFVENCIFNGWNKSNVLRLVPFKTQINFPFQYWPSFSQDSGPSGYFQSFPNGCWYVGTPDLV